MIHLPMPVVGTDPEVVEVCASEICDELTHSRALQPELATGLQAKLRTRIEAYLQYRGNPQAIGPTPFPRSRDAAKPKSGDHLFARYRSGAGTDAAIVQHISRPDPNSCPYCALYMPSKPKSKSPDRDHILPRSAFPEFALLRINLVHVCDDCNEEKGAQYIDAAGNWLFVHPYFDVFLSQRLITVAFVQKNRSLVPAFEIGDHCPPLELARLQRHLDTLDVFRRYGDAPVRDLARHLESARSYFTGGTPLAQIRETWANLGESAIRQNPNDPLGCMFMALALDPRLEAYLQDAP